MSAEIYFFSGETTLDIPTERVLQAAIDAKLSRVIVIGLIDDEPYLAASYASRGDLLLEVERFKMLLLRQ